MSARSKVAQAFRQLQAEERAEPPCPKCGKPKITVRLTGETAKSLNACACPDTTRMMGDANGIVHPEDTRGRDNDATSPY